MLDTSYGKETMEELTTVVMLMARIQPVDGNAETVSSYDAKTVSEVNASSKVHDQISHVKRKTIIYTSDDNQIDSNIIFDDSFMENNGGKSEHNSNAHDEYNKIQMLAYNLAKKAFKERENRYLEDICDLEEKLSSHDRIVYKKGQSIQTIHMLGKTPNKVYDPFLKAGLGYKNPERLKKAIAAQPKMDNGDMLYSVNLKIDSPNSEETLEDAKESRLKMRNKMVQINYGKLNALYETFVPQQEFFVEQTYFSIPSTSNNGSESKDVTSDLPILKIPKESKLLKMFDTIEFYKTDVIPMSNSLCKNLKEIKEELIEEKNELLKDELEKSSSDSKDIQANLLKRIKILENDFKRSQAQSVESSNSVRRPKSKGTKSKNRVLKNTKSSSTYVWKISRSVSIDSNKFETKDSNVCQTNASVSNFKTINVVNDGSNIVCVSCGKDVFLLSHEKCVARYALSRNSNVKRALFTTPVAAKSKNLRTTYVVVKSRLSVAETPKATNEVFSASSLSHDSSQSLGHNLFSIGQFCDGDLEVAFRSNTCYVWNLEGDDLLTGSRDSNLYTISISEMATSSPVCLMSRATSTKSWLWHRRLSCLNFGTINQLTSKDLVDGLPKFKYNKDHLCSAFEQVQRNLKAQILMIRTDNGTEFKNEKLRAFYAKLGIVHKASIARMPQQNGVVERQNRTLVKAARTMLIFSKAPEFLWAEVISSACFTQNRSIVHTRYNKTPYELIRGRKPNIQYFHVFGSLCYPTNDRDDLGKMKPKADIGIFIGYSESSRDMASECNNLEPRMNYTNFQDSSEDSQSIPLKSDLDNLFGPMYEEYYATSSQKVSDNSATNTLDNEHTSSSPSIVVEEDEAPQIVSSSAEQVATEPNSLVLNENVDQFVQEDFADFDGNVHYNAPPTHVFEEAESSSTYQDPSNMHECHQKHRSSDRWTKNHPIEQVIDDPSKPIMTRNRLQLMQKFV
ncbi:retrovirus-related pol polyprotein from transposon TNT 1-94, partial [Tanacetum coccineum]